MNSTLTLSEQPKGELATPDAYENIQKLYTLVKNTINGDLNEEEFQLFMHDCKRQGVHPLDRLIHPTIRTDRKTGVRKYTAITSIDLFRMRAEATGELAGNDDPVFSRKIGDAGFEAKVTVWRMVQGQRCPFTATARWSEYKPPPPNDFMWNTKPHVMLGKCAEALALRKAFPKQLGSLYVREEMEQAGVPGEHPAPEAPAKEPLVVVDAPQPEPPKSDFIAAAQEAHDKAKANGYQPEQPAMSGTDLTTKEAQQLQAQVIAPAKSEKKIPADAQVMLVEVLGYNPNPREVSNGSKTYSLKLKDLENGTGEFWTSTFHKDSWETGKLLKGKQAWLTYKYSGKYINFYDIRAV